jgi:hypothetical protein
MVNVKRIAKWIGGSVLGAVALLWILNWYYFRALRARQLSEAPAVIDRFHQHFNYGQFDAICYESLRCTDEDLTYWRSLLQSLKNRAGKFHSVKSSEIKIYKEPPGTIAEYVCVFEKTGVSELFLLRTSDDGRLHIRDLKTTP